jgi:hypothetical protein
MWIKNEAVMWYETINAIVEHKKEKVAVENSTYLFWII